MVTSAWQRRLATVLVSYLAGAVPFTQIAARRRGADLRTVGDGTVSGTGLYRIAGFTPLAVAGSLDVAKGAIGAALAGRSRPVLRAAAGAAGVAGHNWSVFLRGAGGRGISPALGALGVAAPAGSGLLLAGLTAGRLARRSALGCFLAYAALVPVVWRVHGWRAAAYAAALLVPMLGKRVAGNRPPRAWTRRTVIRRLILDRDT